MDIPTSSAMQGNGGPVLIMIRGLPGSGKSYLAAALRAELGAEQVVVVDPDKIDKSSQEYINLTTALTAENVDAKFYPYRFLRARAHQAISEHKIVIWNQAFTNLDGFNKTVVNLRTYATDHGMSLPVLVVEVAVSAETARARVAQRVEHGEHDVPDDAFARFINEYVSFADQGYHVVAVNGEDEVSTSVAAVSDALLVIANEP